MHRTPACCCWSCASSFSLRFCARSACFCSRLSEAFCGWRDSCVRPGDGQAMATLMSSRVLARCLISSSLLLPSLLPSLLRNYHAPVLTARRAWLRLRRSARRWWSPLRTIFYRRQVSTANHVYASELLSLQALVPNQLQDTLSGDAEMSRRIACRDVFVCLHAAHYKRKPLPRKYIFTLEHFSLDNSF